MSSSAWFSVTESYFHATTPVIDSEMSNSITLFEWLPIAEPLLQNYFCTKHSGEACHLRITMSTNPFTRSDTAMTWIWMITVGMEYGTLHESLRDTPLCAIGTVIMVDVGSRGHIWPTQPQSRMDDRWTDRYRYRLHIRMHLLCTSSREELTLFLFFFHTSNSHPTQPHPLRKNLAFTFLFESNVIGRARVQSLRLYAYDFNLLERLILIWKKVNNKKYHAPTKDSLLITKGVPTGGMEGTFLQ